MSRQAEQLKKDRQKLIDGFQAAAEKSRKTNTGSAWWLLIGLVGSTIPHQAVSLFFAHFTIICILYILLNKSARISKQITAAAIVLGIASIVTGCSPIFAEPSEDIIAWCERTTGESCVMGRSEGWSILGWPVSQGTIEEAKADGQIEELFGTEVSQGHGLVSLQKITVYGS